MHQPDAQIPKATLHRFATDAVHFPRHKNFDGYKAGDTVWIERDTHQRGHIHAVQTLPDKTRLYLVFAPSPEVPDFLSGVYPFMATLKQEDLRTPCIEWKPLRHSLRCLLDIRARA